MMRTTMGLGLTVAMLAAVPAAAMVPVHMDRRNQLRQVIDHAAFDRFGPIERVELVGPATWRVTSGRCHIDVQMVPVGRDTGLSPRRVEARPGRPVCSPQPR
jgi:hypothetical protein